jgi:hypothetical protein
MNKPNFAKFIGDARVALDRHSPEILLGVGIAGMFTAIVLAVKATPKALKRIEEKKTDLHVDKLTAVDTVKATWKYYIPAAVTSITSTACLIGSNSVQARRTAAIATAYKISETALAEYKEKVVETIGEKKEKVLREEVAAEKATQQNATESKVYITGGGTTLCLDPISMRLFESDINAIKRAQNEINEKMLVSPFGYASLNEFYDELGLEATSQGDDMGWNVSTGKVKIDIGAGLTKDNRPCIVLDYRVAPRWDYTSCH